MFRDAVLDLAEDHTFARPLVNSGRLSVPCIYDGSELNSDDALPGAPPIRRPGAPCVDAPLDQGYLFDKMGDSVTLLTLNVETPDLIIGAGVSAKTLAVPVNDMLKGRYHGSANSTIYLIRSDQHVAGRWSEFDEGAIRSAIRRMIVKV